MGGTASSETRRGARRRGRSLALAAATIAAGAFALVLGLRTTGVLEPLELEAHDAATRLVSMPSADSQVALVLVEESDIRALGRWPIPDGVLAEVLQRALDAGAVAVGLDIYRDVAVPPGHLELDALLEREARIVAAYKFADEATIGVSPPRVLASSDRTGFSDVVIDPDGTVRRGLLFLSRDDEVGWSLALRLALRALAARGIGPTPDADHPQHLRLGPTTITPFEPDDGGYVRADAAGYQFLPSLHRVPARLESVTLGALLAGTAPSDVLRDRVVLVGVAAESVKDLFYTPHSRARPTAPQVHGVELHALLIDQLVRYGTGEARPLRVAAQWGEVAWLAAWCLLGTVAGLLARGAARVALIALAGLAVLAGVTAGSLALDLWLPSVPAALGWVASLGTTTGLVAGRERRARARLMDLFGRHVSPEVARALWDRRDVLLEGGRPPPESVVATVMFTDLQGFTTTAEGMSPPELVAWLDRYFEAMVPAVFAHRGVVLRFFGDALLAAFGLPFPSTTEAERDRDAVAAVDCALEMQDRVAALNRELIAAGRAPVGMRVGILTGEMVAGSVGMSRRLEYTVHGDAVNSAARLESHDRGSFVPEPGRPCRILIGEPTRERLGDAYLLEAAGDLQVKGKRRALRAWRVMGRRAEDA